MFPRLTGWFPRLVAVLALTGVLVGPQAMVAASCRQAPTGHHQSHHHQPAAPQHCCDLCVVACSGSALLPAAPGLVVGFALSAPVTFQSSATEAPAPAPRFLRPPAIGPPAFTG